MKKRGTVKIPKPCAIFHLNVLKHVTYSKRVKKNCINKTNKFKLVENDMLKNFRDKSYQMDSLKRLYFIKKVQKNKKPKKIILSFIIYILSKV